MTPKLSITVGLPGSGKTHEATLIMHHEGRDNVILVSRDDLRHTLFRSEGILDPWQENYITKIQKEIVKSGIKAGKHIIVHDMNLREKYRKQWAEIARDYGAEFEIIDCTQTSTAQCILWNRLRQERGERWVSSDVIYELERKFKDTLKADRWKPYKLYPSVGESVSYEKVEFIPGLPSAIIVDIDGTVADCTGVRNPYNTSDYDLDKPKKDVIREVQAHSYERQHKIIFVSGRHESFKGVTEEWLYEHVKVPIEGLYMRYEHGTEDSVIKAELFNRHVRGKYNVVAVYDDRDRVVDMWRSLGLLCLQVAEGDF